MRRRPAQGLLAAMWELPNCSGFLAEKSALQQAAVWDTHPLELRASVQRSHIFTHVEWQMLCYCLDCGPAAASPAPADVQAVPAGQLIWVSPERLQTEIALPSAFRQFLDLVLPAQKPDPGQ